MVYCFGDFSLDAHTRQLLRDGVEIHLTPKAFDLLHVLLANRARAVSKAELQERIWPSTFVEETNLASLVAEIRRALGDTAATPEFVRTIYGFGYQFAGDVIEREGESVTEQPRARVWLMFERRQIPLMEGVSVIGRAPDAAIQIDAPSISRYHARIVVSGGEATLEDAGSKNGTHLNGSRITTPTRLVDGSEIRLGAIDLTFRIASLASPTETMPPQRR